MNYKFPFKNLIKLPVDPSDCWEWQGSINKSTGYGKKTFCGDTYLAHRWVYQILFGRIGDDMVINHKCRNRSCVNPYHLEVVTQAENCRHGNGSKLTKEQVLKIKEMDEFRAVDVANIFGVSRQLINDIRSGRAWKDT